MAHPAMMTNKVTVVREALDDWGERSTDVLTEHRVLLHTTRKMIQDERGETTQLKYIVYFKKGADVQIGDRLRINDIDYKIHGIDDLKSLGYTAQRIVYV